MSFAPEVIDHVALGKSRVLSQFKESPKFNAFLAGVLALCNIIENCFQQMMHLADIDLMTGKNLDTIGVIVGASRYVPNVITLSWFGFEDTGTYATVFGEEGHPDIGARFYEEGEVLGATTVLGDVEYRMLLKAKIVKNNSDCTPESIIQGLRIIFNTEDVRVIENGDKTISVAIGRPIYAFEQAMISALDILPRPAGIRIKGAITTFQPPAPDYVGGTEGANY